VAAEPARGSAGLAPLSVARTTTHVMSCDASVVVTAPRSGGDAEPLAAWALARLQQLEQRWSRFLHTSEISRLNAAGGAPCRVSADTFRLVESLVRAWHATGGAFDPTLLVTLVELGYAASRDDATLRTSLPSNCRPAGRPDAILIDGTNRVVQLPVGTTLDPGGLGKGLAADIVTEELLSAGAAGALVEIGGDLRVAGEPPIGDGWRIAIRPALDGEPHRVVQLATGGIATSSSRLRVWSREGRTHHHLIEPRTRTSTSTDVASCTVIAGTAAWAEAFTKVGFVADLDSALGIFAAHTLAASITTCHHTHHITASWKDFCP
jgi:FAD:protein FMN transferase